MGIFGRDDRTTPSKPSVQPAKDRPQTPPHGSEGTTVIARGNRIDGTISGSGDIQIDGELEGSVDGTGTVRVAPQGRVEGTLKARVVMIAGAVRGDTVATEAAQLASSAKVEGNITSPRIQIAEGARFDGQVLMKDVSGKHQVQSSSARKID
jgi:cytoskeletal protein CcmA (bactofilin family)